MEGIDPAWVEDEDQAGDLQRDQRHDRAPDRRSVVVVVASDVGRVSRLNARSRRQLLARSVTTARPPQQSQISGLRRMRSIP
jgi:hypothetical protein